MVNARTGKTASMTIIILGKHEHFARKRVFNANTAKTCVQASKQGRNFARNSLRIDYYPTFSYSTWYSFTVAVDSLTFGGTQCTTILLEPFACACIGTWETAGSEKTVKTGLKTLWNFSFNINWSQCQAPSHPQSLYWHGYATNLWHNWRWQHVGYSDLRNGLKNALTLTAYTVQTRSNILHKSKLKHFSSKDPFKTWMRSRSCFNTIHLVTATASLFI